MERLPSRELKLIIKERQAEKLSKLTKIDVKELKGKKISEIAEKYKAVIDPKLLLFQKVCGQVVKLDPVTGKELPVPFAKVHVEDTDCNLFAIYPPASMWGWFYPLICSREEITSVTTDECGRFCVWIPRFQVDWILKWRLKWLCYPEIFIRPSIKDILERIIYEKEFPPPRYKPPPPFPPLPDPAWFFKNREFILRRVERICGREVANKLATIDDRVVFGEETDRFSELLNTPAFREDELPPVTRQLMDNLRTLIEKTEELREVKKSHNPQLDPRGFIGPFLRCTLVIVPEIIKLVDVPDITFRVTQDVDSDGVEETIYSESLFDVRWDADPIPDVKLYASEISVPGVACDVPTIPSGKPAILYAGLMPLFNPTDPAKAYYDKDTGYARRPNRPRDSPGLFSSPHKTGLAGLAETPFMATLQLYGRNKYPGAKYYRVLYEYKGTKVPFMHTWPVYRDVAGTLEKKNVVPDTKGWYPILPKAENWHPPNLLMNWPTGSVGLYKIQLELGNAAKKTIHTTNPKGIMVDNSYPDGLFTTLKWREIGATDWNIFSDLSCPVIERPTGKDIEISVTFQAWATHLRFVKLTSHGCGAGNLALTSKPETAEHWHTDPSDNTFDNSWNPAKFSFPSTTPQGAYRFQLKIDSRAFNPAGKHGFNKDWYYNPVEIWRYRNLQVAIVDV